VFSPTGSFFLFCRNRAHSGPFPSLSLKARNSAMGGDISHVQSCVCVFRMPDKGGKPDWLGVEREKKRSDGNFNTRGGGGGVYKIILCFFF